MTTAQIAALYGKVQFIRGLCTDEAPHVEIDQALVRILDYLDEARDEPKDASAPE